MALAKPTHGKYYPICTAASVDDRRAASRMLLIYNREILRAFCKLSLKEKLQGFFSNYLLLLPYSKTSYATKQLFLYGMVVHLSYQPHFNFHCF